MWSVLYPVFAWIPFKKTVVAIVYRVHVVHSGPIGSGHRNQWRL